MAEAGGIVTSDGALHKRDVFVLATGFPADAYLRPMTVKGLNGVTLDQLWRDGFVTYKSVAALPSMPNFFMINGPYSPSSSGSIITIMEVNVAYILKCVELIRSAA